MLLARVLPVGLVLLLFLAGPDIDVPVKTEPGKVTVVMTRDSFTVGETIRAVVANGLPGPIYTADSKTDCSIVFLERWDGRKWETIPGCALGRAPITVAIGSGRGRLVAIDPLSIHLRMGTPDPSKPAIRAGGYRIRLTYRLRKEPEAVEPLTSVSKSFIVRP